MYRGINLGTFVEHFGALVKYIYKKDGFMSKYSESNQQRTVRKILIDLDDIKAALEKKEKYAKSNCAHGSDICRMIWDL